MSRSRDLANLAGDATGLETLTVSDITDLTATATELNYVDGVGSALQAQIDAKQATITTGISNTNVLVANANVADDDFLRVDGTSIEGRTAAETLSDIGAAALAGATFTGDVTMATNKKVKQKGAFMQSSTHQVLVLGY